MRGLVIVLLIFVIVVSISFVAANINNSKKSESKEQNKILEFSTFTSAVCENNEDFVNCKDEVFVNCNGKISKAAEMEECNGIKVDVPKATGFAVFEKEWKDPRN
ncbi:hypothetical protein HYX02_00600 [Candidatus Woesearchaeota archaeon]|nr:hypothetical protein [Candidatus Woesearchaeota archaeon]